MSLRPVAVARITSTDNEQVKRIARLLESARERRTSGRIVIEGAHLISAFARSGVTFDLLAISDLGQQNAELCHQFHDVRSRKRLILSDRVFAKLSDLASPAGILAVSPMPDRTPRKAATGDIVFLDRIQDAGNVGTIMRTAAAAGSSDLVCGPGTTDAWSPRVLRAAMGAHCLLSISEQDLAAVRQLNNGHQVIATAVDGACSLHEMDLTKPTLWLFGNEGTGLDASLQDQAMFTVRIPIAAEVESLNVAAAVAICLFEQRRQRFAHAPGRTAKHAR